MGINGIKVAWESAQQKENHFRNAGNNHFAAVCMSEKVRHVTREDTQEDTDPAYTYQVNNKPWNVSPHFIIRIGNNNISMIADSGASVNLLSNNDYQKLQNPPAIHSSNPQHTSSHTERNHL